MRGVFVEIRRVNKVIERMELETYRCAAEEDIADGVAQLVLECPQCSCYHDLGTWEEVVAALGLGGENAARQFTRSCVVGAARGGQ